MLLHKVEGGVTFGIGNIGVADTARTSRIGPGCALAGNGLGIPGICGIDDKERDFLRWLSLQRTDTVKQFGVGERGSGNPRVFGESASTRTIAGIPTVRASG